MAEFILKDIVTKRGIADQFEIASAATSTEEIWNGVGNPVYPPARGELARHGISCKGKRAVQLTASDYDHYDYLIGMDSMNMRNIAEPEMIQLLPFRKMDFKISQADVYHEEIIIEPSPRAVMDRIVPNYITGFIYGALVESFCSEQNSRMMAMDSATRSAKDMLADLSIKYNRARQAAITQEITEVVGGAKALQNKK